MTEELFDAEGKARRIDHRRVVLHARCRCDLTLMWRLSELLWSKVNRLDAV